jgi:hypothetical protein
MRSERNVFGEHLLISLAGLAVAWFAPATARAQQAPQDPTAVALINQGLALLNGGTALSDVTLQATVTYTSGSAVQTGTGTLQALGDTESLMVLNLTGGQQQEIRNGPAGAWINADGTVQMEAPQNCWTDAAWFFPGLVLTALPGNPQVALANLGSGTWNGQSVSHVQFYQWQQGQGANVAAWIQAFSTEDLYLDPTSALPLAIDVTAYPPNSTAISIPVEVQFSNYQTVSGMSVPQQVEKFVDGSLIIEGKITNVVVNSGLSQNLFNIP